MNIITKSKFVKSVMITFLAILIVFSQFLFGVASPAFAVNNSCKNQQSTEVLATVGTGTIAAGGTIATISAHATLFSVGATVLGGTTAMVLAAPVAVGGGAALATYALWEVFSPDCDSQKIAVNRPNNNRSIWDRFSQHK